MPAPHHRNPVEGNRALVGVPGQEVPGGRGAVDLHPWLLIQQREEAIASAVPVHPEVGEPRRRELDRLVPFGRQARGVEGADRRVSAGGGQQVGGEVTQRVENREHAVVGEEVDEVGRVVEQDGARIEQDPVGRDVHELRLGP